MNDFGVFCCDAGSGANAGSRSAYLLANGLVTDEEARLRFAFILDAQFMTKFHGQTVRMIWEDWINKDLGLRNPTFKFPGGETVQFENWYPTHDVFKAMSRIFLGFSTYMPPSSEKSLVRWSSTRWTSNYGREL